MAFIYLKKNTESIGKENIQNIPFVFSKEDIGARAIPVVSYRLLSKFKGNGGLILVGPFS